MNIMNDHERIMKQNINIREERKWQPFTKATKASIGISVVCGGVEPQGTPVLHCKYEWQFTLNSR